MITTLITDLSRVLLFPADSNYSGSLNALHTELVKKEGEKYDFFSHFTLNEELFALYKNLNGKYPLYIFTSGTIQEKPEIRTILDHVVADIFIASAHHLHKDDAEAYTFIAHKLQKLPQTFLYIDDTKENVLAAQKAEMNAIHYVNNAQLTQAMKAMNLY